MNKNFYHPDKILIFDLKGPFAHFRKYYTNSSSLSYTVPPRTVISGLIAGLLGLPSEHHTNDKSKIYYEKFNPDKCLISVSLKTPLRKIMQTVNYCYSKTQNNEISFSKHSQIPLEILTPINQNDIVYRIYFFHINQDIYNNLEKRLPKKYFVYPPYLGISEFLATIEFIAEAKINQNKENETTELNSICKLNYIDKFSITEDFQYLTDNMPTSFNNNRNPGETEDYVIEIKGKSIKAKFKKEGIYYSVKYKDNGIDIVEYLSPM